MKARSNNAFPEQCFASNVRTGQATVRTFHICVSLVNSPVEETPVCARRRVDELVERTLCHHGSVSLFDPIDLPEVEVQSSPRRRRTISAHWSGEKIIVQVPARMSRAERSAAVQEMVARLLTQQQRRRVSDSALMEMAQALSDAHLEGRARPSSVVWSRAMTSRWGSCTPEDRTIRLSHRLAGMPRYVQEYVLVHELAHLLEAEHNEPFWDWVRRYPQTERAMGYLEGWSEAKDLPEASEHGY